MKDRIHIRYIRQGLIDVPAPKGWELMDELEKECFCEDEIGKKKDNELIEGLREISGDSLNEFFILPVSIEGIEHVTGESCDLEANSTLWNEFISSGGGLLWNNSQKK